MHKMHAEQHSTRQSQLHQRSMCTPYILYIYSQEKEEEGINSQDGKSDSAQYNHISHFGAALSSETVNEDSSSSSRRVISSTITSGASQRHSHKYSSVVCMYEMQ